MAVVGYYYCNIYGPFGGIDVGQICLRHWSTNIYPLSFIIEEHDFWVKDLLKIMFTHKWLDIPKLFAMMPRYGKDIWWIWQGHEPMVQWKSAQYCNFEVLDSSCITNRAGKKNKAGTDFTWKKYWMRYDTDLLKLTSIRCDTM